MNDGLQDVLAQMMLAAGRLDRLISSEQQQTQESQAAMRTAREQEEAKFKQAMMALFREQQQRMEDALRPKVAWAWKIFAVLAVFFVLLLAGFLLLLKQANDRLQVSQARAEAAAVRADVQEASQHVEITSCGGRPCIKLDKNTPTWKTQQGEYVLVDGKSDLGRIARRGR